MNFKKLMACVMAAAVAAGTVSGGGVYVPEVFAASPRATVGSEFTDTVKNAGIGSSGTTDVIFTYRFTEVGVGSAKVSLVGADGNGDTLKGFTVPSAVGTEGAEAYTDSHGKAFSASNIQITGIDLDGKDFSSTDQIQSINMSNIADKLTVVKIQNFDYSESASKKLSLGLSGISGKFKNVTEVDFSGSHVRFDSSSQNDNISLIISGNEKTLKKLDISNLADGVDSYNSQGGVTTNVDLKKFTALTYVDLSGNAGITSVSIAPDVVENKAYTTLDISGDTALTNLYAVATGKDIAKYKENNPGLYQGIRFITASGATASTTLDLSKYNMRSVDVEYAMIKKFVAPQGNGTSNLNVDVSHNYISSLDLSKAKGDITSLTANENQLLDIDLDGQTSLSTLKVDSNYLTSLDISKATSLSNLSTVDNFIPESKFTKNDSQKSRSLSKQKKLEPSFCITGDGGLTSPTSDAKGYVNLNSSATVNVLLGVLGAPEGFAQKLASTVSWDETSANSGAVTLGKNSTVYHNDTYIGKQMGYRSVVVAAVTVNASDKARGGETVTANYGGEKDTISVATDEIYTLITDVTTPIDNGYVSVLMKDEMDASAMFDFPQVSAKKSSNVTINTSSENPTGKVDGYSNGIGKALYTCLSSSMSVNAAQAACKVGTANVGYTFNKYSEGNPGTGKPITMTGDTSISAEYNETQYSISFSAAGGSGSIDKLTDISFAETVTLPKSGLTSNNATFLGWKRDNGNLAEGLGARLYLGGKSQYGVLSPSKTSITMYAIWQGDNRDMKLSMSSAKLNLGDVINTADLEPKVTDGNGLGYNEWDGTTKSTVTTAPKFSYFTSDDSVIAYNDQGAFYAIGNGTATIYVYDTANSVHAVGTINVTVGSVTPATDDTSKEGTYTVAGSTYTKFGSGMILTKAAKKTSMTINTVTIDGTVYKVIGIGNSAFKDNTKLKKVTIGANVTSIGQTAFLRCKNLKTVVIKSKKLKKNSTVGKNAFKKINKKATIKIVKSAYTKTQKVLKKKAGIASTVKYKKI